MKTHFSSLGYLILLITTSCSTFQYATVSSELNKNNPGRFVYENDTVRISYWFAGQNCPVQIEVFNKLNQPVFIDWKKSALITNEVRFAYWKDEALLNASTSASEIKWTDYFSTSTGTVQGALTRNEQVSFIPPQSLISVSPLSVKTQLFELPKPTSEQKMTTNNQGERGRNYLYNTENSPLQFRSFLTLSLTDDFKNPVYFDHRFWVSDITQSPIGAAFVPDKKNENRFYIRKSYQQESFLVLLCVPVVMAIVLIGTR